MAMSECDSSDQAVSVVVIVVVVGGVNFLKARSRRQSGAGALLEG